MCGIAGIWTTQLATEQVSARVVAMAARLGHRGPDDEGVNAVSQPTPQATSTPTVVFGHRRLSILDLSAAGHQPMRDAATGNWITYNGEIYNFAELRAELAAGGHAFVSRTDTEVILKAYAEWGTGCWRRLRGIFAFGLWDARFAELHLVRDQLGTKPLYFAATPCGLAFASEVRALLAAQWVEPKLSRAGLVSYLKYGSVQEPCSMVEGIASLPPGHCLTIEESGERTERHYWRMEEGIRRNWLTPPAPADVLGELEDTVRRQLVADVPVGVFLSGGVDSTAVAALAARAQPGAVQTFCIGTDHKEHDESDEAAETARLLGCRHTTLRLDSGVVHGHWQQALGSYDQPSADGINTYFISLLVRQAGIKVALSGLGGDELFIGYSGFQKSLRIEQAGRRLGWLPAGLRTGCGRWLAAATAPGHSAMSVAVELLSPGQASPYFSSRLLFSRPHIGRLLRPEAGGAVGGMTAWERREQRLSATGGSLAPVDRISYYELQTYMLSTLLRDSDQMSMAHGLELRVPLVDHRLIEQVFSIPTSDKITPREGKHLLVSAIRDLVPSEILQRPKRGFTLPFRQWLAQDLEASVAAVFQSDQLRGPWEPAVFRRVWEDFRRGRVAWSRVLALFMLEHWMTKNGVSA